MRMDNVKNMIRHHLAAKPLNTKLLMISTIIFLVGGQYSWSQQRALLDKSPKPPIIYGHAHIAKTSGTNLNGAMSLRYTQVCGNKGYSYDAVQLSYRSKEAEKTGVYHDYYQKVSWLDGAKTAIETFKRDRVFIPVIKEIGFEDCDWISLEGRWQEWIRMSRGPFPLELHIPCRDPVDHLMSQCNHLHKEFNCQSSDLRKEIEQCIVAIDDRFNKNLERNANIDLKCFDFRSNDAYLDFMEGRIETRKFQVEYVRRETNSARNKENECIWNDPSMVEYVESYLLKTYDYYDFCSRCMHSENDLFA